MKILGEKVINSVKHVRMRMTRIGGVMRMNGLCGLPYLWLASCCQHSVIMEAHGQSRGTRGLSPSLATLAMI